MTVTSIRPLRLFCFDSVLKSKEHGCDVIIVLAKTIRHSYDEKGMESVLRYFSVKAWGYVFKTIAGLWSVLYVCK